MSNPQVRTVQTCATCKHCFIKHEYDETPELYCTLNAPTRPLCGCLAMNEEFSDDDRDCYETGKQAWDEWAKFRYRHTDNVCDAYEKGVPQ